MRIILRLNEQRDQDIIFWLNHQENRSEGIREAIRKQIEREDNVNAMIADMIKQADALTPLGSAIADVRFCIDTGSRTLEDVKKLIGYQYQGEREQLLDQAWQQVYGVEKVELSSIYGEEHNDESDS